jgi:DNA polymerase III delta prime subunit
MSQIPLSVQKWIQAETFPQRVLFSGGSNSFDTVLEIASALQGVPKEIIEKGIHSDTIIFRDTGKSFKIDWSNIAKKEEQGEFENVRGLIRWSHQKPSEGTYRIALLENFERVSRDAPHALLKLIEEPPIKTIFLFTTRNHHQLLDTILSRMTIVRLGRETEDFEIRDEIRNFFESQNLIKKFQYIEELNNQSKIGKNSKIERSVFFEFLEEMIRHARFFEKYQLYTELLFETHQAITQNVNPRFALERMAIKMTQ